MDIGDIGEDEVSHWATSGGFVVNPSIRDRFGWDHILEMEQKSPAHSDDPLGLPTTTFACRIQIKSTWSESKSVRIKLSNLKRAIQEPLPWFVLVLRYKRDTKTLLEVFVIHIAKEQVETISKTIFSLSATDKTRLHKKTLSLKFSGANKLATPFDSSMHSVLASVTPAGLHAYALAKNDWYSNAGLADPNATLLRFSVGPSLKDELFEKMALTAVGISDGLEVENMQFFKERFGKELPVPNAREFLKGKLKVSPADSEGDCAIVILGADGSRTLTAPVLFRYSGSVFPMLPKKHWIMRLQRAQVDFTLRIEAGEGLFTFFSDDETQFSINDWRTSANLISCFLSNQGKSISLAIERFGSIRICKEIAIPLLRKESTSDLLTRIEKLLKLCHKLSVDANTAQISLTSIQENTMLVDTFLNAIESANEQFQAIVTTKKELADYKGDVALITDPHFHIGGHCYIEVFALIGRLQIRSEQGDEAEIQLTGTQLKHIVTRTYKETELGNYSFESISNTACSDLEKTGIAHSILVPWASIVSD